MRFPLTRILHPGLTRGLTHALRLGCALALAFATGLSVTALHAAPLNVVLIVADDLGAHDLGVTGSTFHKTPHLDRLASEGTRFTQAYSACTVCSPSRAALLTGKYPARLHLTDWIAGHNRPKAKLRPPSWTQHLPIEEATLADRLHDAGYTTMHLGKWHLGGEGFEPTRQGFDAQLAGDHRGQPPSYFAPYKLPYLPDGPAGEYLTDRESAEAAQWIAAHADKPFFLNYWPYAVHTPLQAPKDLAASYEASLREGATGQTNATYAAMLERLDAAVGRILKALDEAGVADRTLVLFTSDNGGLVANSQPPTSNAPLRAGKGSPYEGGHRVPLIVKWPKVTPPGSVCAEPVMGIDLLPTILHAVHEGPQPPKIEGVDGVSLVELLRQPASSLTREALYWHYPHYHPGGARPYAAIRSGPWKLIQDYETGRHELYNLSSDPAETANVAEAEQDRVMNLTRKLFSWQNAVRAQWPMPNPNWEPASLAPAPDGSLLLHARDAFVHGEVLRYEPQPFKNTLGWWSRREDSASWTFNLPKAGRFQLEILQGCGNGSGGSEIAFTAGDQRIVTQVIETGGFQNFVRRTLGEITLPAGHQTLTLTALTKPGPAVMDLREILLRPVASQGNNLP